MRIRSSRPIAAVILGTALACGVQPESTLQGAARLNIADQFVVAFVARVEQAHPEYFADLPPLPAGSR